MPPVPTPLRLAEPRVTRGQVGRGRATVSISWRRARARVAVVDAVDVGEQHQRVGPRDVGDERGEPVVVAEADLLGGDRVVLVDDRQRRRARAAGRRSAGRCGSGCGGSRSSAVSSTWPTVTPVPGERVGVGLHQPHLADAGRGLRGGEVARAGPQAQRRQAGGDRAGGDQHDLAAGGAHRAEDVDERVSRSASSPPGSVVSDEEPTLTTTRRAPAISGARRSPSSASSGQVVVRPGRSLSS